MNKIARVSSRVNTYIDILPSDILTHIFRYVHEHNFRPVIEQIPTLCNWHRIHGWKWCYTIKTKRRDQSDTMVLVVKQQQINEETLFLVKCLLDDCDVVIYDGNLGDIPKHIDKNLLASVSKYMNYGPQANIVSFDLGQNYF